MTMLKETRSKNGSPVLTLKLSGKTKQQEKQNISILYPKLSQENHFYFLLNTYHHIKFRINLVNRFCEIFVIFNLWAQKYELYDSTVKCYIVFIVNFEHISQI